MVFPQVRSKFKFELAGYTTKEENHPLFEGSNTDFRVSLSNSPGNDIDPPGGRPVNILGTVRLTGATDNSGITVELLEGGSVIETMPAPTVADGSYSFWQTAGSYTVRFSKTGYVTQTRAITVADTNTTADPLNVPLVTLVTQ